MKGMKMKKITVSLPDDLAEAIEKILNEEPKFRKRSHLLAGALSEYFETHYPDFLPRKELAGPLVLRSLRARGGLRGPSPALRGRPRLEGFRIE